METINFSEFIAPEAPNKRVRTSGSLPAKVQEFDNLKYRRTVSKRKTSEGKILAQFTVSKKLFNEFDLANHALRHFAHPQRKDLVILGVVSEKDGRYMKARKNREKGDSFKSEDLEARLAAAGILDLTDASLKVNQFVDVTPAGTNVEIQKYKVLKAYTLSKGTAKVQEEKGEDTTVASAPTPTAPKTPEAKAEPVAAQAGGDAEWEI